MGVRISRIRAEAGREQVCMKQKLRIFWTLLAVWAVMTVTAFPHAVSASSHSAGFETAHHAEAGEHLVDVVADCASASFMHPEDGGCAATASHCFSLVSATNAQPELPWTLISLAFPGDPSGFLPVFQPKETPPPRV